MIHTADTVRILRVIAGVLAIALFLWSTSLPGLLHQAEADAIINASDTLSDSTASTTANHTLKFTLPNGMAIGQTITVSFPSQFWVPAAMDFEDFDLVQGGSDQTLAAAAGAGTWGATVSGNDFIFETPTDAGVGSSTVMIIRIGDHATSSGNAAEQIENPVSTTTSYGIDIDTTWDSGQVRVAIVDNVTVSAQVNTVLTFAIQGTTTGTTINGSPTTTSGDTTAISLPFGTLSAGTSEVLGQDLFVTTNAAGGFVVTVEATGPFDSSTSADIDWFDNGTYVTTPSPWAAPSGTLNQEETYGHWAMTSDDDDFSGTQDRWISPSTSPQTIFEHNGVADGQTADAGWTTVGYQAEITSLQEAGDDYETTLIYIATPTF